MIELNEEKLISDVMGETAHEIYRVFNNLYVLFEPRRDLAMTCATPSARTSLLHQIYIDQCIQAGNILGLAPEEVFNVLETCNAIIHEAESLPSNFIDESYL